MVINISIFKMSQSFESFTGELCLDGLSREMTTVVRQGLQVTEWHHFVVTIINEID